MIISSSFRVQRVHDGQRGHLEAPQLVAQLSNSQQDHVLRLQGAVRLHGEGELVRRMLYSHAQRKSSMR